MYPWGCIKVPLMRRGMERRGRKEREIERGKERESRSRSPEGEAESIASRSVFENFILNTLEIDEEPWGRKRRRTILHGREKARRGIKGSLSVVDGKDVVHMGGTARSCVSRFRSRASRKSDFLSRFLLHLTHRLFVRKPFS